jgi:hypothetical protein
MEGWGSKTGLGRPGEPSEVATSFVFLASAEASLYCKYSSQLKEDASFLGYLNCRGVKLIRILICRRAGSALLSTRRLEASLARLVFYPTVIMY